MIRAILLLSLAAIALTATVPHRGVSRFHNLRRGPPPVVPRETPRAIEIGWMTQKLDHFNPQEDRTWQQRYFTSADVYVPGGPVFLFLGGEWEANGYEITETFVGDMAAQHGAFMIDLEHRYYGQSHPTDDITSDNLKWLNADQALEDAAVFTRYMMDTMDLTGPWFVFGGSYSANLAAWARARYPDLYYAAHASSGPVLAQLDFLEYMEVVNEALTKSSTECPTIISAAMDELFALVEQGDADKITSLINFCETIDLSNPDDVMNLYSTVAFYFAGEVQYARGGNLDNICNTLSAGQATPLDTVAQMIRDAYDGFCVWSKNQDILDYYRDDIRYSSDVSRQWFYQTCLEYGYYQTLSSPNQPFGQVVPVEFSLLWCPNVYGPEYDRELNEAGIANTNEVNGGLTPDATRVLHTHGSLDPWHALGLESDLNPDVPVIIIDGESHCRDIGTPSFSDSQALKDARLQIEQVIADWVAQAMVKK